MKIVVLKPELKEKIVDIIKRGIEVAKSRNCEVHFDSSLNGVYVMLGPDSELEVVMRDYERSQSGCVGETIGPHYEKELSPEVVAREAEYLKRIEKALDMESEGKAQLNVAKMVKVAALLDFIQNKEMTFLDEEAEKGFRKVAAANDDWYGSNIVRMANDLARLLEFKLGINGKITPSLVQECEQIIFGDYYGASGFQANTAENIISQYWFRGAEFFPFTYRGKKEAELSRPRISRRRKRDISI